MYLSAQGGKSKLIRDARELAEALGRNLPYRRLARAVNAIFDLWAQALARGEPVELPGGFAQCQTIHSTSQRHLRRFRNIHTGQCEYKIILRRAEGRRICYRPHAELVEVEPWNEAEESGARRELLRLVQKLTGTEPDGDTLRRLREASPRHTWSSALTTVRRIEREDFHRRYAPRALVGAVLDRR